MSVRARLSSFLVLLVMCIITSEQAQAQNGQRTWDPLSLARATIYFDVSLNSCDALRSQPTFEERSRAIKVALPHIFDALTARAQLVHPNRSADILRAEVRGWFDFHKEITQQTMSEAEVCKLMPDHVWSALAQDFASQEFPKKMQRLAESPFSYRRQIPLIDGSTSSSYALPASQKKILTSIASITGCDQPVIDGVYVVVDQENDANNLPAFLGGPVTYAEVWVTLCDGHEHKLSVLFTRDSETMLKEPIVEPL